MTRLLSLVPRVSPVGTEDMERLAPAGVAEFFLDNLRNIFSGVVQFAKYSLAIQPISIVSASAIYVNIGASPPDKRARCYNETRYDACRAYLKILATDVHQSES